MRVPAYVGFMPGLLARFILTLAVCLPCAAWAEPLPRKESNVSIRNEVQLAIDKGLAHLQTTQRPDGSWGTLGTTGFVLMAFQRDPRGRYRTQEGEPVSFMHNGYVALRRRLAPGGTVEKMQDFAWQVPPAVLALQATVGQTRPADEWHRAKNALAKATPPKAPETLALFQDAGERDPFIKSAAPSPPVGSATAAWIFSQINNGLADPANTRVAAALAQLGKIYTLDRNPGGEGVHRYYFWVSAALVALDSPELTLADGTKADVARQLAEKLINAQNGNGSWSGVGDHWTEKDPDLVTAMCLLTLEQVYGLL
jgi:phosphatidylethanolamine-binding protein (PEBP) family uncharacterized protein